MEQNAPDFEHLSIDDLVSTASDQPVLADEVERGLVQRMRDGDVGAAEELVLGHLRIAIDEAIRTRGLGLPQRDLVRLGVRALVEAARSYDPDEHGRFSHHARSQVRRVLRRSLDVS
jgi:RNA polymerase sigma-32 factor